MTSGPAPRSGDAGALTLSYVIVFPAVLFAILVIVQASLYYMAHNLALTAARQGADAARAYGVTSADTVGTAAAMALVTEGGSGMLANASAVTQNLGTTIQVTVTGSAWSIIPGLPTAVSETVQEPIERFVP